MLFVLCCCMQDRKFPPGHVAIGSWKNKSPQQIDSEIKWCVESGCP